MRFHSEKRGGAAVMVSDEVVIPYVDKTLYYIFLASNGATGDQTYTLQMRVERRRSNERGSYDSKMLSTVTCRRQFGMHVSVEDLEDFAERCRAAIEKHQATKDPHVLAQEMR